MVGIRSSVVPHMSNLICGDKGVLYNMTVAFLRASVLAFRAD